jgi:hypothetical protein
MGRNEVYKMLIFVVQIGQYEEKGNGLVTVSLDNAIKYAMQEDGEIEVWKEEELLFTHGYYTKDAINRPGVTFEDIKIDIIAQLNGGGCEL